MKLSSIPDFSETESLNDSDLFLVTKKNDNNGYVSNKITYNDLASQIIEDHESRINAPTYESPADTKSKLLFSTCFINLDVAKKGNFSLNTLIGTKNNTNYYYRVIFSNTTTTSRTPTITIYRAKKDNPSSSSDYQKQSITCNSLKASDGSVYSYDYDTYDFVVTNNDLVYIDNIVASVGFSICIYENGFPTVTNYKNQTITDTESSVIGTGGKVDYNCSMINQTYKSKPKDSTAKSSSTSYIGDSAVYMTKIEQLYGYGMTFTGISVDLMIDGNVVKSGLGTYTGSINQNQKIYYRVTGTYKKQKYTGRKRTTKVWIGDVTYSGSWVASGSPLTEEYTTTTEVPIAAYTVNGVIRFDNE